MREINHLVVHCSYTPPSMDIGADEVRQWHKDKGWRDIGYHYVIRRNGSVEKGRPEDEVGAHAKGYNLDSIGICLIGGKKSGEEKAEFNFTMKQLMALDHLIKIKLKDYPGSMVSGHNQLSSKSCPCFNVPEFVEGSI